MPLGVYYFVLSLSTISFIPLLIILDPAITLFCLSCLISRILLLNYKRTISFSLQLLLSISRVIHFYPTKAWSQQTLAEGVSVIRFARRFITSFFSLGEKSVKNCSLNFQNLSLSIIHSLPFFRSPYDKFS